MTPAAWGELDRELAAWQERGLAASFWWRDDDAVARSPALERLLGLAGGALPLALAVIPAALEPSLAPTLVGRPALTVLQHGFGHANRAPAGEKKAEFGGHRPVPLMLQEVEQGRRRLQSELPEQFLPVFVPPWNRLAPGLAARLSEAGILGVSSYGPRAKQPPRGLLEVNTHIDVIDWHGGRGFVGEETALELTLQHLRARRSGAADAAEPTGLLTHHLVHDAATWSFLERFLRHTQAHSGVRWIDLRQLFAAPAQRGAA